MAAINSWEAHAVPNSIVRQAPPMYSCGLSLLCAWTNPIFAGLFGRSSFQLFWRVTHEPSYKKPINHLFDHLIRKIVGAQTNSVCGSLISCRTASYYDLPWSKM